ncbi:branched-chain amino acid transport system substrate-binding protein [Enhydrobacter aerosaccus]|uniref:Branched-chain amino acid transport system substrate-binding protein n=1 Tax=Enhydrobacter aerosaccus TaxID=225324 RepID=A0A1T4L8R0_9HYPH|nr:ABC transporter substrate-binding protein [Enhydrobacter aerosaccus]SJZ51119.1 branched-chain amino acid transport system substrate-binding protein [Enhydrobacter aerosaccus]
MRRGLIGMAALALAASAGPGFAQVSDDVVKIGVATDMASLYADINGPGAVVATQMAIDEFGGSILGKKIELVTGDIQNKADVAATLGGRWYDSEKVDMILGAGGSASSIALERVAGEKKKIFLAPDPASSDITGKLCNAYTVHWVYDTTALANGTGAAVVKSGGKTWFFLTADYAFGYALERDVSEVVKKAGGTVLGSVRAPINTSDFSSFLLQAQGSKAQIIGLANAGGDTINSIKQAAEFGIVKGGQKLAGLLVFISDVHSLGLERAQGLRLTEAFYWDLNDKTRDFSKRFAAKFNGKMPTMVQAGFYSATRRYLEAIKATGTDDADKVMANMKSGKWDDPVFGPSYIRPDGRNMHAMYLFEVKSPSESKGPWDYYKLLATIPGEEAFRPLDKGDCPLVAKN